MSKVYYATGESGCLVASPAMFSGYSVRCAGQLLGRISKRGDKFVYYPNGLSGNSDNVEHDSVQECLEYLV